MSANKATPAGGGGSAAGPPSRTVYMENPATGDVGPDFFTKGAITLSEMRAIILGGTSPSVAWTIRFDADRSAAGTIDVPIPDTLTLVPNLTVVTGVIRCDPIVMQVLDPADETLFRS